MAILPVDFKVDYVQLQSIRGNDFREALKSFNLLLCNSIGPNGNIKIVESRGGIAVVTTSSKRLIDWIELDNPLLHVIANAMKNQCLVYSDFGLYTGLTSTNLLLNILNDRMPYGTVSNLFRYHCSVSFTLLEELRTILKVDFSSVDRLLQIVETMISSKPLSSDSAVTNIPTLAVCIVGAFLRGFSEKRGMLGRISVVVDEGTLIEPPTNFSGVIYEWKESFPGIESKWNTLYNKGKSKIMVVLFAVNLTASKQNENNSGQDVLLDKDFDQIQEVTLLQKVESCCEKLVAAGVCVIACQKVIHPDIKFMLQRRGVLALERMGKELADSFAALTGAAPLGCLTFDEVPEGCIGELESVEFVEKGQRTYVHLKHGECEGGIVTILAGAAGEQQAAELKVVIHQSLQTLSHLVRKPYVYPGSGCLEAILATQLSMRILLHLRELCEEHGCSPVEMLAVLKWFRNAFFAVSRSVQGTSGHRDLVVDSVYNHCWQAPDAAHCSCGLLTKGLCDSQGCEWISMEIDSSEEKLINFVSSWKNINHGDKNGISFAKPDYSKSAHLDVCSSKLNAICLALETVQSVLSIGMVVY